MRAWWWLMVLSWCLPGCASGDGGQGVPELRVSTRASFQTGEPTSRSHMQPRGPVDGASWLGAEVGGAEGHDGGVAASDLAPGPTPEEVHAFDYECHPGVTEACLTVCGSQGSRTCYKRWGDCVPPDEGCNYADDDCDGLVDEGVASACGTCIAPPPEQCNGQDDDCDGLIDEAGNVMVNVNINGDCVFAYCPSFAPFPIGCDIQMHGGDAHGCIASHPNVSEVYFQEGDVCNAGFVSGSLTCSCAPQGGLHSGNCAINEPIPHYVQVPWQCPGW
ncbi:MAG: hypothetical protein QF464_20290 [Myxococcota bacterium]|nr:hypothetical protein [Myxococcota bacterium]